jgi:hypothetical protein
MRAAFGGKADPVSHVRFMLSTAGATIFGFRYGLVPKFREFAIDPLCYLIAASVRSKADLRPSILT